MAPFAGHLRFAARLTLLAACGLTAAALAAGCGSTTHTLHLTVSTGLGPRPHAWTIGVASTGSGSAVAGLVLTYPNGHKSQRSDFLLHDTGGGRAILLDLSSGTYGYRVYAVKVGSNVQSVFSLPARDLVAKNMIASGSFTIPVSATTSSTGIRGQVVGRVRAVVERFGYRLQSVGLQSAGAARQIRTQYAGLVAPALITRWVADPSLAPGRQVSSPWPDHVVIGALAFRGSSACSVSGHVVMMTSVEVVSGGSTGQIPVRLQLRRIDDRWLITGYVQRPS